MILSYILFFQNQRFQDFKFNIGCHELFLFVSPKVMLQKKLFRINHINYHHGSNTIIWPFFKKKSFDLNY